MLTTIRFVLKASVSLPLLLATGCLLNRSAKSPPNIPHISGDARTAFALRYIDIKPGTGALLTGRQCVYAHYTGWLTDGKQFDSSRDTMPGGRPKQPISFPVGARRVISGWDLGFDGMRVGGQRRLLIPYQLAYGEAGRPPLIPAKSELIFDVELMALADTLPTAPAPVARADSTPRRPAPTGPQCPTWATVSKAP